MLKKDLKKELVSDIKDNEGVNSNIVLLNFKNNGGLQLEAYQVAKEIREVIDEEYEVIVLNIMDTICGTVAPSERIWDGLLSNKDIDSISSE